MNQTGIEQKNQNAAMRAADRIARTLCSAASAGRSSKQLGLILAHELKFVCARCLVCGTEWPLITLGRDTAHRIGVVAKRARFLSLRRRLEALVLAVRPSCATCASKAETGFVEQTSAATVAAPILDENPNRELSLARDENRGQNCGRDQEEGRDACDQSSSMSVIVSTGSASSPGPQMDLSVTV